MAEISVSEWRRRVADRSPQPLGGEPDGERVIYLPGADSLLLHLRTESSHRCRVNGLLTLHLSRKDDSLVGIEVKSVSRILEIVGEFGVAVHDHSIKLGAFLRFALSQPADTPIPMDRYRDDLRQVEDVPIDTGILQAA